jgi:DNA-binding transcriptional ArsR family regulator
MDEVFKALADPSRRRLLDSLRLRSGQSLRQLSAGLDMTRQSVSKHLATLEAANLVVTARRGREKLHFLNPVPIRLIHDRWINKYGERQVTALADLKRELEDGDMTGRSPADAAATTQVYRIYIRASAQAIWDAITLPEWTNRYGYTGYADYELRPGGTYRVRPNDDFRRQSEAMGHPCPDVIVDGEVLAAEPPRRLSTTWRMLMDPEIAAEGVTRLTYEIKDLEDGSCSLTVTHDVTGAPKLAELVAGRYEDNGAGGGWSWILSDLKSLLETERPLAG